MTTIKTIILTSASAFLLSNCRHDRNDGVSKRNDSTVVQADTLSDYARLKAETNEFIEENNQKIDEYKTRMKDETAQTKAALDKKVDELKAKNEQLKQDLNDYKEEGSEKWESFKLRVKRSVDDIKKDIDDYKKEKDS